MAASGKTAEVFTYANLTTVFETEVYVDTNNLTGQLLVVPLSGRVPPVDAFLTLKSRFK